MPGPDRAMKVILSVQSIKYPLTGIGRYTYELARHLPQVEGIDTLAFHNETGFVPALPQPPDAAEGAAPASRLHQLKRFVARSQLIVEAYRILRRRTDRDVFKGFGDHLYHGPNFYLPRFPGRTVVTVHDLSVLTMPQFHPRERVVYLGKEIEAAARRATRIITDSHYTRAEVLAHFGFAPEKVGVAQLACGAEFRPRSAEELAPVLGAYGLSAGGYALYTGTIEPRKNIAVLVEAYGRLPADLRRRYPLVLAGYKGWNNEAIMDRIARGQAEGWLTYLGYVPNDHLPALFSGARLFAFPSLYEGFGLPVLEAMASRVPVIASDQASLPEVGGEAAAYVAPGDVEGLTALCERCLTDEDLRRDMVEKGLVQAGKFSWRRCAEDTVALYRAANGA